VEQTERVSLPCRSGAPAGHLLGVEDQLLHALTAWRAYPPTAPEVARLQDELAVSALADIEAQLTDGSVPLLTTQELRSTPGQPRLLLRVVTVPNAQLTEIASSLRLVLVQSVTLEREVRIRTDARTWETNLTGIAKAEDLIAVIRARARDLADVFAKDFRAANSKH